MFILEENAWRTEKPYTLPMFKFNSWNGNIASEENNFHNKERTD